MRILVVALAVIVLGTAGFIGYAAWNSTHSATSKDSLARGYNTQPLGTPFTLISKSWFGDHWEYKYAAGEPEAEAQSDAKAQFGRGAYQVVSDKPDTITSTGATLYRDLITEDIAVKVQVDPESGGNTPVMVYVRPIEGK